MDKNKSKNPHILIVDDKKVNIISLEAILKEPGVEIIKAESGNEALGLLLEYEVALILMDVQMPKMTGFETAEIIRENSKSNQIPIIFVSAINKEEKHIFAGYDSGAVDYLFKPVDTHILKSKVNIFLDLYRQKKELEVFSRELQQALTETRKAKQIIEKQNRKLNEIAIKDGLTGLYNHRHMDVVMESEFNRAKRYQTDLSCLLMDLDFFKEVNDTMGHPFGDFVLKEFAVFLQDHMRETDLLFRYGGEEFLVILPQTDIEGAKRTAEKFRKAIELTSFNNKKNMTMLTTSIGVSTLNYNNPKTANDMISFADKALFSAKAEGRNRVVLFKEPAKTPRNKQISNDHTIKNLNDSIGSILKKTKKASMSSLELLVRDSENSNTTKHNRQVREYISLLGHHLNLPPTIIETFKQTATLHDCLQALLGKNIIEKKGKLSDSDLEHIKNLPYILSELTLQFDFFANERNVLLTHHENYDGSGYPEGLEKEQIPMGARIFSIADSFVAMTLPQPHRRTKTLDEAVLELASCAGSQFDPALVAQFLNALEKNEPCKISSETFIRSRELLASHDNIDKYKRAPD